VMTTMIEQNYGRVYVDEGMCSGKGV
jgi:hypothetical protein